MDSNGHEMQNAINSQIQIR